MQCIIKCNKFQRRINLDKKLNLDDLRDNTKSIKIGELTTKIIETLNLDAKPRNIYMWSDRLEHCDKHKNDFSNEQEYINSLENIPLIIQSPDYVGVHSNNKGIFYIKKLESNCLVGVTMDSLLFRSMYPIKESKLTNYIKQGKIFPIK